jgi:hypothetical protein
VTEPDRSGALATIARLAAAHELSLDDIAAALRAASATPDPSPRASALTRLLAYLGGVFVFAGLGVFIAMQWDEMNSAARVVITLGSGVAAFAMAVVATRDVRLAAAVTPLDLIAAVLQPLGMLVAMREYSSGGDWHHASLATAGVMLIQQLLAFYALRRNAAVFAALLFGAILAGTALDLLDARDHAIALTVGAALLCLTVGIGRTRHAAVTPFWYFVASALTLWGLFDAVQGTAVEVLFLGAACAAVYLSVLVRSRAVLVVATIAILGYVGYFTAENFANTVGWPLALIAFGLVMIALSVAAVSISRRYIQKRNV